MTDKGEKLSAKLEKVRKNIEDTRRLIAYHKKMLKIYIRKESEIADKLEKEQLNDLFKTVKDKGCDIEAINTAINNGEFQADTASEDSEEISSSEQENVENRNSFDPHKNKNREDNN